MDVANITLCLKLHLLSKRQEVLFFCFYEHKTKKQMYLVALRLHISYFVAPLSKEKTKCRKPPEARDA